MDRNKLRIGVVVIGVMAILGGMVWTVEKGKQKAQSEENTKQVVAMVTAGKITVDQAIKTALDNFPGTVIEAELEKRLDTTLWEVQVLTEEQAIMVVQVDAESGSVISTAEKMAGKHQEQEEKP